MSTAEIERESLVRGLTLVSGVGDAKATACIMSARSLLDGRPFGDQHPSETLRRLGIRLNDGSWWDSDAERTATLLPLALDERLCASRCVVTAAAEGERRQILVRWAREWCVPYAMGFAADAMESAAKALDAKGKPEHATKLRGHAVSLRATPTREVAQAARRDARAAYAAYAADAAAADADAADAADAAYAAAYAADAAAADAAGADAAYAAAYAADAAYAAAYAADAADTAAYAADAADTDRQKRRDAARTLARRTMRDQLIGIFNTMLDVGQPS